MAVADIESSQGTEAALTSAAPAPEAEVPSPSSADVLSDHPLRTWARRAAFGDLAAALLATVAARGIRFGIDGGNLVHPAFHAPYMAVGLVIALSWPLLNAFSGAYEYRVALFGVEELRRLGRSAISLLAILGTLLFLFDLDFSRGYVALLLPILVALSAAWRMVLRHQTTAAHQAGIGRHRAVAVGPVAELERLSLQLLLRPGNPVELVAYVADDLAEGHEPPQFLQDVRRLRSRTDIEELSGSGKLPFDLLLRAGQPDEGELWSLARLAHASGSSVAVAPSRADTANVSLSYVPLGTTPLLLVETPALKPAHRVAKAVFDRSMAVLLLVLLSPVLLVAAVAIKLDDRGPVLFRQPRVGRNGELFPMVKFRSMVPDAEGQLASLSTRNDVGGPIFKVLEDPRITKVGHVLRRFSLDELPQLLNVIRGEMSIVGPRPYLPDTVATYDERTARRLLVKPGMTGLWQVNGRSDLPWDEGVYLDLLYVDHWSPLLDLVIIARTARVLFRPSGAY